VSDIHPLTFDVGFLMVGSNLHEVLLETS